MSNDVLTFPVDAGVQGQISQRTRAIKFGDGYEQEVGGGLNPQEEAWPISAAGPIAEIQPLIDFLDTHPGSNSFLWSPPHRAQARYKCRGYSITNKHGDEVTLTATFLRTHQP